ncbi:hypothetical protein Slin15195_G087860 [Septoria linicola]|uniref:Uncharacterized protein n=1 Tax=Septoria linicola TaxID=215465 RepID=A0A9Q9B0Z6_9PEZI|nr:hypothetical protein Slin14017_G090460 [Septoria linicola]USW55467.1 hypothetical protein Slin15195_G087860 [Septoria linicola]
MATTDSIILQGCLLLIEDDREALLIERLLTVSAALHYPEVKTGDCEAVKGT